MMGLVSAWTPSSNIDLRDYYNITNAPYYEGDVMNASTYYGDGSNLELGALGGDNASWNESHADTKYINQSEEGNLNVNSSGFWDTLDTISDILHNGIGGLQGGASGEYYHLNQSVYNQVLGYFDKWLTEVISPYLYLNGSRAINFNETKLNETIDDRSINSESDPNWEANFTNMQTDCPNGNYTYGVYDNGTLKCRDDEQGVGGGQGKEGDGIYLYNDTDTMYLNETQLNDTIDDRASGSGDNASFNETYGRSIWIEEANESNLNVNQSDFWDNLDDPTDITHNDLGSKQGGSTGEYYHINQSVYNEVISEVFDWITSALQFTSGPYLYNDSNTIYFNETRLNDTIDDRDSDTTYSNGSGLNLNASNFFNISVPYSFPQGCNDGEIAEYNTTSGGWDCAIDDQAASGMSNWILAADDTAGSEQITEGETVTFDDDDKYLNATRSTNTINYSINEVELNATIDDRAVTSETDPNWSANFTNMQVDCPTGNYTYGIYGNGTFKCRSDVSGGGDGAGKSGDYPYLYNDSSVMYFNETKLNETVEDLDTNCSTDGACDAVTYDSELDYTVDTSAYVNCSSDEIFYGNGSCGPTTNWDTDSSDDITNNTAGWTLNFTKIFSLDWTNITILESQISDLSHTVDTSAYVNCSSDEIFYGNGSCGVTTAWDKDDTDDVSNNTAGWTLNFTAIFSLDWSNITILESQISDLSHTVDTSAYVNCSSDNVFLGNGSCRSIDTQWCECSADDVFRCR